VESLDNKIYGPPTDDFYAPRSIVNIAHWSEIIESKILFKFLESTQRKKRERDDGLYGDGSVRKLKL
jgi:hypothetical protein